MAGSTHYGITHINASLLPISRQAYGECIRGSSIGAVLTARSLDEYASALPLCYTQIMGHQRRRDYEAPDGQGGQLYMRVDE